MWHGGAWDGLGCIRVSPLVLWLAPNLPNILIQDVMIHGWVSYVDSTGTCPAREINRLAVNNRIVMKLHFVTETKKWSRDEARRSESTDILSRYW
jgi:hypothetical protein